MNVSALKITELSLHCEHFQGTRNVDKQLANFNTLRTGDADLRFYITTVQDG